MNNFLSQTNKLSIAKLSSIVLILILFSINEGLCQRDSLRFANLIKETNELFISPFAHGVLLSPFEIKQHHRDKTIKNIEWVNSFDLIKITSSKKDSIPYIVKNNQTIIQKPDERFNSRTYSYYKDGRIHKIFRGRHLDDLFLNDDDGFLIQHGSGGELKKAKRKGKILEWYNVKNDRLEYTISYDEKDRLSKIKTMGHFFGRRVEHEIESYSWEGNHVISRSTIRKYKEGSTDSTFVKFTYDSLGLISTISHREGGKTIWSSSQFDNKIEHLDKKQLKITISNKDQSLLSITFDHFDNVVEMKNNYIHLRKEIKYRKKKRWLWF